MQNNAPTIATPASATPNPVTGTTTALSVLGNDDGGEANLTYTWAVTSKPASAADPTYNVNGTNAAKSTTATFYRAGSYTFQVTISDGANTTTSSVVVTVTPVVTTIIVTPSNVTVDENGTQQFLATAYSQFGIQMGSQPSFTWSVSAGLGSVNSSGLYTAPESTGSATVTATASSVSGTASVTVVNVAPTVVTTGSTLAYTENDPATAVDSGVTVTDDGTTLTSATITISSNYASGEVVLAFVDQNGISGSWNSTTGVLTLSGSSSLANYQAALRSVTYVDTSDNPSTATRTVTFVVNDGTNNSLAATRDISVAAVNDAPVNSVPGAQTINEDTNLVFFSGNSNLISISDADAAGNPEAVTLTVTHGVLTLSGTTGLSFISGDGTADVTMSFTGTVAAINAALNSMTYTPDANFNGNASLQIVTNDQGNSGSGGALSDTDSVTINVSAVNDAPVNTVPGAQTTNEDTTLVFSSGNSNLISIDDVDAGASPVQVTLTATHGALTLSGITGLSFTTGDGTSDATMVFTGTLTNINAALAGMSFTPTADYNGAATVQIVTNDQGNTGSGGPLSDTDSVNVTVNAVNDAPVNSVPGAQTINEDTNLVFLSGNSNLISISDVDAGGGSEAVTLTVTHGVLSLSGTTGLSFTSGDGTADVTMSFTGTVAAINTALNSMTYTPDANYNGAASLQIVTNDQGNTGSGGPLSDTDSVTINVSAVNDAPVNTIPGAQTINEATPLTFSTAGGNAISISDVDAGSGSMRMTLTATHGSITLASITGLSFTTGDGTADASMVFTGTLADINSAFDGMSYTSVKDYGGSASLTITTNDQGNTGSGGAQSDSDSVPITVVAVNDPPVNTVPGSQTTAEDTPLTFSTGNGNIVSIDDEDAFGAVEQLSLTVTHGTLTLAGTSGLTFTAGDGSADTTMTFKGTLTDMDAALDGMVFTPDANYNGNANLNVQSNDLGNTGIGGQQTATSNVALTITAVNDAPVNSVPAAQSLNEDGVLTLSTANGNLISISDVDAGSGNLRITLTATHGTLTLATTSGLSFTTGDGTADATMTFTGDATSLNAALDGLTYSPSANYNGAASIQITTNDQGNTGSGGPMSDTDAVSVTVNAVNDAPVNTVPASQTTAEDTPVTFSTGNGNLISVNDVDAGSNPIQVTLTATNGTLTLADVTGLTFTVGGGSNSATMTFTGTQSDINVALDGMTFTPTQDFNGSASVQIVTNDQGNTGSGGPLTDSDTVGITVTAVNDAPVNTMPDDQSTNENVNEVFSAANANQISVSDVDANGAFERVTLTATHGTLTLNQLTGLSFTAGDGTADATMTFQGTLANINAALNGLTFIPQASFIGIGSLQVTTNDLGNTGGGGAQIVTNSINVEMVTEFRANTTITDNQTLPATAMDEVGDYVIVWVSNNQDGQGLGIYAQRYDHTGTPVGGEFRVNQTTANDQTTPSVAMDQQGDFVVTWASNNQDGNGWGVYARRYDLNGNALRKRVPREHHHAERSEPAGHRHGGERKVRHRLAQPKFGRRR